MLPNTGNINATADYIRFIFSSANAQTLTNTGTMTSPVSSFDVSNSNVSGLTISSNSNTIVVFRVNLFAGVVHNSNKITLGTGSTSYAVVQRGVESNTVPAGSFDVAPTFDIAPGNIVLIYDNGFVAYSTGYEVPSNHTCALFYIYDASDVSLSTDLTISDELNFAGGIGTATLRIGAHTLTVDGSLNYTVAGALYGGTSSNLIINGPSQVNAITGGLKNFEINAACTLGGAITVYDTLTLTSGLLTNGNYLTMATGTTISRSAAGSIYSAPTFAGTVNLLYTGTTPIKAGKELPTSASVINNLTTNPGGFTQYAGSSSTTNLLTDAFPNLTSWTGNIGTGDGTFSSSATTSAGGTSPEVKYTGCFDGPFTHSNTTYSIYRTSAINTTGYDAINVAFKSTAVGAWQIDYPTSLNLQCATSTSGPWSTIWSMSYAEHAATNMSALGYTTNVGGNMYVRFAFVGDWYCLDNWNFDNLVIDGIGSTAVASDITVNGTLYLVGDYTIGSINTLRMANNATINRSDGIITDKAPTFGTLVNLVYSNTSVLTTAYENPGTGVDNLTLNNSASAAVTLGKNTTVNAVVSNTGSLVFDGKILTINGKDFAITGTGTQSISALTAALSTTAQDVNGSSSIAHVWTSSGTQSSTVNIILSYPESESADDIMLGWNRPNGSTGDWTNLGEFTTTDLGSTRTVTITGVTTLNDAKGSKDWTLTRKIYTLLVLSTGPDQPGTEIFKDSVTTGKYTLHSFTSSSAAPLAGSYSPGPAPAGYHWVTTPIVVAEGDFTAGNYYTVTITFVLVEDELPVELSSFTATISVNNYVNLTWVTQTETGVLGFYILRNTQDDLANALTLNDLIAATNTSQQQTYVYTDNELYEDGTYYYWLENLDLDGTVAFHGPISINYTTIGGNTPEIPLVTELKAIYPNPFNPRAFIPFSLKESAKVNIDTYNTRGQLVRRIPIGDKAAGQYQTEWDGRDDQGRTCSTGVYHIRMTAGSQSFFRKAVLMK